MKHLLAILIFASAAWAEDAQEMLSAQVERVCTTTVGGETECEQVRHIATPKPLMASDLTARDVFAAGSVTACMIVQANRISPAENIPEIYKCAYTIADAMLKERDREKK